MSEAEETPLVRQRNTTPYTFNVAETKDHPAYAVLPGEEATLPTLLDGWTPVEEPEPQHEAAAGDPQKIPSRKRAAAADTDKDGGEPR